MKAVRVYGLSNALLPLGTASDHITPYDEESLASDLAAMGYPGFFHLRSRRKKKNPAELLLSALNTGDLDSRIIEALPWVVLTFPDLDWQWLISAAKVNDLQNRLGFVTSVARRLAEQRGEHEKAALLASEEARLERSGRSERGNSPQNVVIARKWESSVPETNRRKRILACACFLFVASTVVGSNVSLARGLGCDFNGLLFITINLRKELRDANTLARPALRRANVVEEPRLHLDRCCYAQLGHWREHGDLQRG